MKLTRKYHRVKTDRLDYLLKSLSFLSKLFQVVQTALNLMHSLR